MRKMTLARRGWRQTTATQEWIANKPGMISATDVSQQIRRLQKAARRKDKLLQELKEFVSLHERR